MSIYAALLVVLVILPGLAWGHAELRGRRRTTQ